MPILPRHPRAAFLAASALTAAVALSGPAQAGDDEPSGLNYKAGALDLHLGVDAGLAYYGVQNAGNGTGSTSRSGEHTSDIQSLMRISYAVSCLTQQTNSS